jgi:hypothetical protein
LGDCGMRMATSRVSGVRAASGSESLIGGCRRRGLARTEIRGRRSPASGARARRLLTGRCPGTFVERPLVWIAIQNRGHFVK